jgi:ATP phosphoribosyltransferase
VASPFCLLSFKRIYSSHYAQEPAATAAKTLTTMSTLLRIAIQKSGRLQEGSLDLLHESGLSFSNGKDQLKTQARNFPVEILFLRDDDIPQYVEDQVADVGIVGENVFCEKKKNNELVKRLDFAKCRLSMAVPRSENYTGVQWLNGKNIATSYPNIVKDQRFR